MLQELSQSNYEKLVQKVARLENVVGIMQGIIERQEEELLKSDRCLSTEDAAKYLRTSKSMIRTMQNQGILKATKMGHGFIFRKKDLDQIIEDWNGYDLSTPESINLALKTKKLAAGQSIRAN